MKDCICPQCGQTFQRRTGDWNRAQAKAAPLYCGRTCAGLARRSKIPLTPEQEKAAKAEYDRQYRERNKEALKAKKAAYFKRTYDPEKARITRAARMQEHVEYCRQPWYVAWKREYDRQYKARKDYGEFAEIVLAARELAQEVDAMAGEEVKLDQAREKTGERRDERSQGADRQ